MKRTILAGLLVLATGFTSLIAADKKDKNKDKDAKADQQQQQQQQAAQPAGPHPKSKEEQQALMAVFNAQGKPDEIIAAAENVITKFADTDFKDSVLYMEAEAYRAKGDREKAQIYAERTVAANPKHFQAQLLLAEVTVQGTREHDLDRDQKLAKADQYAKDAIASIGTATKPNPQITDEQWEGVKKDMVAEAHDTIGLSALQRKDYNAAITEFKTAVDGAAHVQPAFEVRLASAYQQAGKNDEAIAMAQKVMDEADTPQQIKSVAQSIRAAATVAKNGPAKPAGQAPPPQVQVNPK